jgi:hypothetical protein
MFRTATNPGCSIYTTASCRLGGHRAKRDALLRAAPKNRVAHPLWLHHKGWGIAQSATALFNIPTNLSSRPERVARSGEIAAFVLAFLVVILREAEDLRFFAAPQIHRMAKPGRSGLQPGQ